MKEIPSRHLETLHPVVLYLDDINNIIGSFRRLSENVIIEVDKWELENLNELSQIENDNITTLRIRVREPYISLDIDYSGIWIHRDDSYDARGLCAELKDYLAKRRRPLTHLTLSRWYYIPLVGGLALLFFGNRPHYYTGLWVTWLSLGWLVLQIPAEYSGKYSRIYLSARKNSQSFLQRKRDEILVALLSSIVTGLFTFLITYYAK